MSGLGGVVVGCYHKKIEVASVCVATHDIRVCTVQTSLDVVPKGIHRLNTNLRQLVLLSQ